MSPILTIRPPLPRKDVLDASYQVLRQRLLHMRRITCNLHILTFSFRKKLLLSAIKLLVSEVLHSMQVILAVLFLGVI